MNCKKYFLLPHKFQIAGWWGLLASAVVFILLLWADICVSDFATPPVLLAWVPFYASLLLICISKEKIDDEYISMVRGRIVCYIVVAFVLIKMLYLISNVIILCYGDLATAGIIGFVNILLNPVILMIIYIIAFRITIMADNRRIASCVEQ